MCTEEATRKIVTEGLADFTERNKMPAVVKILLAIIITAFGSAIGFNTTTLWAMQESINESQADYHKKMITMVAKNTALIAEIESWKIVHENTKDAAIREFNMLINHNTRDIYDIVNNKADDRWRLSDEISDNEKKDLFHASLVREDEYLRETIDRNCTALNTEIKILVEDIEDIENDYQELHDEILNLRRNSTSVQK